MDDHVKLIQAGYDGDLVTVRQLWVPDQSDMLTILEAAILGDRPDVLTYLVDQGVAIGRQTYLMCLSSDRGSLLTMLLQRAAGGDRIRSDRQFVRLALTLVAAKGHLPLLNVLRANCHPTDEELADTASQAVVFQQRAVVEALYVELPVDKDLIVAFPDLALRKLRDNPLLFLPILEALEDVIEPRPAVLLAALQVASRATRSDGLVQVHRHLNTDAGWWTLQRLPSSTYEGLPGLHRRTDVAAAYRSALIKHVGHNLTGYIQERI